MNETQPPKNQFVPKEQLVALNRFHTQDKLDMLIALTDRFGDEALQITEAAQCKKAKLIWQHIASQTKDHSVENLIHLLWEPLREKGFEFDIEPQKHGVRIRCTRCPVHELARELKAEPLLYRLVCSADPFISEGFNPSIGFLREKTLMQGDDCCNHTYVLYPSPQPSFV